MTGQLGEQPVLVRGEVHRLAVAAHLAQGEIDRHVAERDDRLLPRRAPPPRRSAARTRASSSPTA